MRAPSLIETLSARGIHLGLVDGRLRVQAPPGLLDDDLRQHLRAHRDALVAELSVRELSDDGARCTARGEANPFLLGGSVSRGASANAAPAQGHPSTSSTEPTLRNAPDVATTPPVPPPDPDADVLPDLQPSREHEAAVALTQHHPVDEPAAQPGPLPPTATDAERIDAAIDAVLPQALELGWTEESLLRTGHPTDLATDPLGDLLDPGDVIVSASPSRIGVRIDLTGPIQFVLNPASTRQPPERSR